MRGCLGLSVGATSLVAVTDRGPLVRPATFTLPDGLQLTAFVERVGDPVSMLVADGSAHRGERVLAAAIDALIQEASPARRPESVVVAVPTYWRPAAFEAIRRELPGMRVVPDAVAALTAVQVHPGLPTRGVVALCDIGATGATLTLADAGARFSPLRTLRYDDFSGDLVDQELLRHVLAHLDAEPTGTAAVAALSRLRAQCRGAKELLSSRSAVPIETSAGVLRLTRAELETMISGHLDGLVDALLDMLRRTGIQPSAVVTAGGGARVPLVTQRLSEALRMPVVTVPQAGVIAAVGAGLLATRRGEEPATRQVVVAPRAPRAWSVGDSSAEVVEYVAEAGDDESARPAIAFVSPPPVVAARTPWYRGMLVGAAGLLAVVGTVGLLLSARADGLDAASAPGTLAAPPAAAGALQAPPTRTVVVQDPGTPAPAPAAAPAVAPAVAPPAAAPYVVQRQAVVPPPAFVPEPAPRAAPAPAPDLPALPQLPVPVFHVPELPALPWAVPPLPIPTFVPRELPTHPRPPEPTAAPTKEPTKAPEPAPESAPTAVPTAVPTPVPEPTGRSETSPSAVP